MKTTKFLATLILAVLFVSAPGYSASTTPKPAVALKSPASGWSKPTATPAAVSSTSPASKSAGWNKSAVTATPAPSTSQSASPVTTAAPVSAAAGWSVKPKTDSPAASVPPASTNTPTNPGANWSASKSPSSSGSQTGNTSPSSKPAPLSKADQALAAKIAAAGPEKARSDEVAKFKAAEAKKYTYETKPDKEPEYVNKGYTDHYGTYHPYYYDNDSHAYVTHNENGSRLTALDIAAQVLAAEAIGRAMAPQPTIVYSQNPGPQYHSSSGGSGGLIAVIIILVIAGIIVFVVLSNRKQS